MSTVYGIKLISGEKSLSVFTEDDTAVLLENGWCETRMVNLILKDLSQISSSFKGEEFLLTVSDGLGIELFRISEGIVRAGEITPAHFEKTIPRIEVLYEEMENAKKSGYNSVLMNFLPSSTEVEELKKNGIYITRDERGMLHAQSSY